MNILAMMMMMPMTSDRCLIIAGMCVCVCCLQMMREEDCFVAAFQSLCVPNHCGHVCVCVLFTSDGGGRLLCCCLSISLCVEGGREMGTMSYDNWCFLSLYLVCLLSVNTLFV